MGATAVIPSPRPAPHPEAQPSSRLTRSLPQGFAPRESARLNPGSEKPIRRYDQRLISLQLHCKAETRQYAPHSGSNAHVPVVAGSDSLGLPQREGHLPPRCVHPFTNLTRVTPEGSLDTALRRGRVASTSESKNKNGRHGGFLTKVGYARDNDQAPPRLLPTTHALVFFHKPHLQVSDSGHHRRVGTRQSKPSACHSVQANLDSINTSMRRLILREASIHRARLLMPRLATSPQ